MWTVVFVTQDREQAQKVTKLLTNLAIMTRLRPTDHTYKEHVCFEVLVPYAELNEALDAMIDIDA